MSKEKIEVIHGSGNIWRDLDYPDADVRQAKGILAARVVGILSDRNLSIRKAQKLTGFAAADFSRIRNADYGRFTIDRLIRMLQALDSTVEVAITIRTRPQEDASAPQA